MTWNIHGVNFWNSKWNLNFLYDSKSRYPFIKKAIEYYNPDLLLLQEVVWPWDNSFVNSFKDYHIHNREIVRSGGIAVGTKEKARGVKYTPFKTQARLLRPEQLGDKFLKKGIQEVDLGYLKVINNHFANTYNPNDISDSTIQKQSKQLLELVRERKKEGINIIVGGDLNFRPNSDLYQDFTAELEDLTKNLGEKERDYHKVDYLFANCGQVTDAGYVYHPSFRGSYPSDHRGIYVDIKLNR